MRETNLISVIIPVYNVAKYLEATVESVISQTYKEWELLLINDGSTDDSLSVCNKCQKKDSRIRVIDKENGGPSSARNTGIEQARGEYIYFLDGDDLIMPHTLERLIGTIQKYQVKMVTHGIATDYRDALTADVQQLVIHKYDVKTALKDLRYTLTSPCNKLYHHTIWETLRFPVGKFHEDEAVYHYVVDNAGDFVAIEAKYYYYVQREGSTMHRLWKNRVLDGIEALEDRVRFVEKFHDHELQQHMIHEEMAYLMRMYQEIHESKDTSLLEDLVKEDMQKEAIRLVKDYPLDEVTENERKFMDNDGYLENYLKAKKKEETKQSIRKIKNKLDPDKMIKVDGMLYDAMRIQVVGRSDYFYDYSEAICEAFQKNHFNAVHVEEIDYSEGWDAILFIGASISIRKQIQKLRKNKNLVVGAILTEQPYAREFGFHVAGKKMVKRERKMLSLYDIVFVWSEEQMALYKKYHERVIYFPHSFYEKLDHTAKNKNIEKKYDLIFLGEENLPHRKELLEKLKSLYTVIDTNGSDHTLWGEEKFKAIMESRICLNIHQEPGLIMESPRLYDYFSNRAFVLSETMKWPEPFVPGEDFDVFYYTNVIEKIEYYLEHPDERQRIADHAYEKVHSITMDKNISIIIDAFMMELYYKETRGSLGKCIIKFLKWVRWKIDNL